MNHFVWYHFPRSTKIETTVGFGNFFEGVDYPAPWPDNPAWPFVPRIFPRCCLQFDSLCEVFLPCNLIFDLLSVTCVHMLIPVLSMPVSLTGGSGVPKRKCRFIPNEEGVLVDEVVIRQCQREATKKIEKEKLAKAQARRRKGKATRPDYKNMPEPDYILVRRNDWYATPRNEEIEDRGFWCEE
jgi:hypothetical protein